MAAPNVNVREIDLSTRVPSFPGVYGAILIPNAKKGPVGTPYLVTGETQFLKVFTPDERVEVGYDSAYYSAIAYLQKSDKLWIIRVSNDDEYGGVNIVLEDASQTFVTTDVDDTTDQIELTTMDWPTDTPCVMSSSGTLPAPLEEYTTYYLIFVDATTVQLSLTAGGSAIDITDVGSGTHRIMPYIDNESWAAGDVDPADNVLEADEALTIYGANPGEWNDDISVRIRKYYASENLIPLYIGPYTFTAFTFTGSGADDCAIDPSADYTGTATMLAQTYRVEIDLSGTPDEFKWSKDGGTTWEAENVAITGAAQELEDGVIIAFGTTTGHTLGDYWDFTCDATAHVWQLLGTASIDPQFWTTGTAVLLATTSGTSDALPSHSGATDAFQASTPYYVINVGLDVIQLADSAANAAAGQALVPDDVGTGTHSIQPSVEYCKEPGAFTLYVYKGSNHNTPVETWICSMTTGHLDGFNKNVFIEDVLEGSNYVRAMVNAIHSDPTMTPIYPKEQIDTTLPLIGGDVGMVPVNSGHLVTALGALSNADDIPVTLFMDGGYSIPAYQLALVSTCEARQDSVAILSMPYDKVASSNYLNEQVDYRKNVLNVSSSYAALYTPSPKIYDKFNDRYLYASPDGFMGSIISETASNYEMWYPPAGFRRGVINVLDLRRRFEKGEMDLLYDNGINPIRFAPGRGIVAWGQKTLSARPSALDRLNVRLLLIVIEPAIKLALEDFIFELNDAATRAVVTVIIDSYMKSIQARRGVYDYQVTCDGTNNTPEDIDNYIMNVWLFVKPVKAVEYIPFTVIITRTGMDFSLAAELL